LTEGVNQQVPNELVEKEMVKIDQNPDLKCGAIRMTAQLQLSGFIINHKKAAGMMNRLNITGKNKRKSKNTNKKYVQYRVLNPTEPLSHLQMDIKSHWLVQERYQAYTLSVIDTFTKEVHDRFTGYSVRAVEVRQLWETIESLLLQLQSKPNAHIYKRSASEFIQKGLGTASCPNMLRPKEAGENKITQTTI